MMSQLIHLEEEPKRLVFEMSLYISLLFILVDFVYEEHLRILTWECVKPSVPTHQYTPGVL